METRLYTVNDMAKAGCNDCQGCFSCCQGMGDSIVLDPYDIWQLEKNTGASFAGLMQKEIELHVENGLILPNLKMQEKTGACAFLNEKGRCGIHDFRPGLCRLFPLGRKYENEKLYYFVLEDACKGRIHTKLKIKKQLGIEDIRNYEEFLTKWHGLRKDLQTKIAQSSDEYVKDINMKFLRIFYEAQYTLEDFFTQFEERRKNFLSVIK